MTCFAGYLRLVMDNVMESEALSKISPTAGPQPWLPLLRCSNGCQYDGDVTQLQRGFIRRGYLHSMHRHGGFARHGGTPTHHTCIQIYTYTHLLCIYMWYIHIYIYIYIYISYIIYIYMFIYIYMQCIHTRSRFHQLASKVGDSVALAQSGWVSLWKIHFLFFSMIFTWWTLHIYHIHLYIYIYTHIFIYVNYIYICICIYIYMYTPDF